MGRKFKWAGITGHKLILDVKGLKDREGLSDSKAIAKLCTKGGPWDGWDEELLNRKLYVARGYHGDSPSPVVTEEDRWIALLIEWGKETKRQPRRVSAELARNIVNRLIAVAGHWRPHLDKLFVHMERRIHWNGRQRINWIEQA